MNAVNSEFLRKVKKLDAREVMAKFQKSLKDKLKTVNSDLERFSLDVGIEFVKNKTGIKMDVGNSKLEKPQYFIKLHEKLYVTSETIHDLFAKNNFRSFRIKCGTIKHLLKSNILTEVLCYDENHFNISDSCSKK